jgi:hypothetical protein
MKESLTGLLPAYRQAGKSLLNEVVLCFSNSCNSSNSWLQFCLFTDEKTRVPPSSLINSSTQRF